MISAYDTMFWMVVISTITCSVAMIAYAIVWIMEFTHAIKKRRIRNQAVKFAIGRF